MVDRNSACRVVLYVAGWSSSSPVHGTHVCAECKQKGAAIGRGLTSTHNCEERARQAVSEPNHGCNRIKPLN
jgi:hypothetical protein